MATTDAVFSQAMAEFYDRHFGPPMFAPQAEQLVGRLRDLTHGALLEVAAGTGIVTAVLARTLPRAVEITATDLNQPMLDFAAAKPGMGHVSWRQADAMALPFPDASFDAVVCQFGVMFFPDRARAHAEAWRVLKPGGRYLFNVWGPLAQNPAAQIVQDTVAALYPDDPPGFLGRTPFGYNDPMLIRTDLRAGGFAAGTIEMITTEWRPASPRDPALAFCLGSPLRAEIERLDPAGPERAVDTTAAAIVARFGEAPSFPATALLVDVRK